MTVPLFLGCAFVAYGPSVVMLFGLVWTRAPLLLVTVTSAFFWLISLFVASIFWTAIPPMEDVPAATIAVTVLLEEGARWLFMMMYRKAERGMRAITPRHSPVPLNDLTSSLASGLGFGIMQSVVMYGSLLASSTGEATLYSDDCPAMSLYALGAGSSLLFTLLHVFLSVTAFDAYRKGSALRFAGVVALHLGASFLSLMAKSSDTCSLVPLLVLAVDAVAAGVAWWVATRPGYKGTKQARRWAKYMASLARNRSSGR